MVLTLHLSKYQPPSRLIIKNPYFSVFDLFLCPMNADETMIRKLEGVVPISTPLEHESEKNWKVDTILGARQVSNRK